MSPKEGLRIGRVTATTKGGRWNVAPAPTSRLSGPSRSVRALICLLIMVALLNRMLAGTALVACTAGQITSDTEFYGQSPPVYPSRKSAPPCNAPKTHRMSLT